LPIEIPSVAGFNATIPSSLPFAFRSQIPWLFKSHGVLKKKQFEVGLFINHEITPYEY